MTVVVQVDPAPLELAFIVDFPDVGPAVVVGVDLGAAQLTADVEARFVVLTVTVVIFTQLGDAAFGKGDPGVHLAVEVGVGHLVQGFTLVRIGAHDILHAIEVGVDFTAHQHAVSVFTLADDSVYATDVGFLCARSEALDDFTVAATLEVTARAIVSGDTAHLTAQCRAGLRFTRATTRVGAHSKQQPS